MIRLIALLRRAEHLSAEEFDQYWREVHGPLMANTEGVARHIRRYEQHPLAAVPSWARPEGYDGVAMQWFDSWEGFEAMLGEPDYAAVIAPDEARFLDRSGIVWMMCDEPRVVIGS